MKLQNIHEVEDFRKVIHQCKDDVFLKSQEGDVFTLKSAMSEYIAVSYTHLDVYKRQELTIGLPLVRL